MGGPAASESSPESAPEVGDPGRGALDTWLRETQAWSEGLLKAHLASEGSPAQLEQAMAYSVLGGGKRLRPALVRLTCSWMGGADSACELPAVAVELIHAYSLIHDDLPCMDDDDLRRGRPSNHKVHGEALAILAGDGLQARAFELLASGPPEHALLWLQILTRAAGAAGMVGGQVVDMTLEGGAPDPAGVRSMHAQKTAALISASAELGAVAAGVEAGVRATVAQWGLQLGLLFQATDDLLDVTGDAAALGKTPGKDAAHEKPTLVAALGLSGARAEAELRAQRVAELAEELGAGPQHPARLLAEKVLQRNS